MNSGQRDRSEPAISNLHRSTNAILRQRECVVCIGEVMAQILPADGYILAEAPEFAISNAGAESNVAIVLSRMGRSARYAGYLGDDPMGHRVRAQLTREGVNLALVRTIPGKPTGVFFKDPRPGGSQVYYYRHESAATFMDSGFARECLANPDTAWLHVSGVTSALSLSCTDLVITALVHARQQNIYSSFDVNYRPALWSQPALAARTLQSAANKADVVFVGLDEAADLWGITKSVELRRVLPEPDIVVVKEGGDTAVALTRQLGVVSVPALQVQVVEPVGAGDAFAAGWIHAGLLGMDLAARLRMGHILASFALSSVQDRGSLPKKPAELEAWALSSTAWQDAMGQTVTE